MMRWSHLHSIRHKLLAMVVGVNFLTLIVAGMALHLDASRRDGMAMVSDVGALASMLVMAATPALNSNDAKAAKDCLALLQAKRGIVGAAIYTASGRLLATYGHPSETALPLGVTDIETVRASDDTYMLHKRIVSNGETRGTLTLEAQRLVYPATLHDVAILGGVMLLSLLVSVPFFGWLLVTLLQPVRGIEDVAKQVRQSRDFQLRVPVPDDDEMALLVDAFNEMLAEIGRHAEGLEQARQQLAHEVAQCAAMRRSLEYRERRSRSLIEASASAVWIANGSGSFNDTQDAWERFTGQGPRGYQGLGWRLAFHPDDQALVEQCWSQASEQPRAFEVAARLQNAASGRFHVVSLRAVPMQDENGNISEWIGSVTDIDDRVTMERELRQLNVDLERRVVELTQQVREADRDLESFSYSVSHDLRAPVRAISGFSKILSQKHEPLFSDDARRLLGIVMAEANRMGLLIDDLLAFSRLGRQAMFMALVDMQALARTTFEQLMASRQGQPVQFQLGAIPACYGDVALLRQVWINLLSNAVKFSSKVAQPVVEVGVAGDGERLAYYVRDNGVGFDTNYQSKLFGVFQRLHSESEFPGNGVGLALVQRIVMRHGGTVWAESGPGEGATFYFTLPREPENGAA